jgi:hypothetical protein
MKLWNLTEEKKNELLKQRDNKQQELKRLQAKSKEQMWEEDLTALLEKMDEVEAKEREEDEAEVGPNAAGKKGGSCNVCGLSVQCFQIGILLFPRHTSAFFLKLNDKLTFIISFFPSL